MDHRTIRVKSSSQLVGLAIAPCPSLPKGEFAVRAPCHWHPGFGGIDTVIPSAVNPWSECWGYNPCGPLPLSALAGGSSSASGAACGDFFSAWRLRMLLFLLGGLSIPYPRACFVLFP